MSKLFYKGVQLLNNLGLGSDTFGGDRLNTGLAPEALVIASIGLKFHQGTKAKNVKTEKAQRPNPINYKL